MQIHSLSHCLRSRRISAVDALTDLTPLAMFRLNASPRQGITVRSAFSRLSRLDYKHRRYA